MLTLPRISKRLRWIIIGVGLATFVGWCAFPERIPSDADLVAHFQKHREAFEELRAMLLEDTNIVEVSPQNGVQTTTSVLWQDASHVLTESRHNKYIAALRAAGAYTAVRDGEDLRFPVGSSGGMANRGWRVAVTWRSHRPEHLLSSLDQFRKTTKAWEQGYREIQDGWYLWIIW